MDYISRGQTVCPLYGGCPLFKVSIIGGSTVYIACSGCDKGLRLCDGRLGICYTYYFEDVCVEECPEESHVVDEDLNCVERTLPVTTTGTNSSSFSASFLIVMQAHFCYQYSITSCYNLCTYYFG